MKYKVAIIDDDFFASGVFDEEYKKRDIQIFNDPIEGLEKVKTERHQILFIDYRMQEMNGYELLLEIKKLNYYCLCILISAYPEVDWLHKVLNQNLVVKYIRKPFHRQAIFDAIEECTRKLDEYFIEEARKKEYKEFKNKFGSDIDIIGLNSGLRDVYNTVEKISPFNVPILLQGATGTGKEIIANLIHRMSGQRDGPYIKINCCAIPETLFESELFGHKKGSFTGAIADRPGKIEKAHTGTLFLDEIGELPLEAQAKLLRAIQEKKITRLGENVPRDIDFRLITATNRNITIEIKNKNFREDLYHRIASCTIEIPPLKSRVKDIPELVRYLIELKGHKKKLSKAALRKLLDYEWPGNIRELFNSIEVAIAFSGDKELIEPEDIHLKLELGNGKYFESIQSLSGFVEQQAVNIDAIKKHIISYLVEKYNGNKTEVAKLLNVVYTTVDRNMVNDINAILTEIDKSLHK